MTVEQRDKYAYELMVKNNPEEAVKQLLLKDKENARIGGLYETYEEANSLWIKKCEDYKSRIDKAIEFIKENADYSGISFCSDLRYDECLELLKILKGDK